MVEAAYSAFVQDGFEGFDYFAFELRTKAIQSFAPERIKNYLTISLDHQGAEMCKLALEYILLVLGKYLQMLVAYRIHKQELEKVAILFQEFNGQYQMIQEVFQEVTGTTFKPGEELDMNQVQVARVKPSPREKKEPLKIDQKDRDDLCSFLRQHGLLELQDTLVKENVTLADIQDMNMEEMRNLGIHTYKLRRTLSRILSDTGSTTREVSPPPLGSREEEHIDPTSSTSEPHQELVAKPLLQKVSGNMVRTKLTHGLYQAVPCENCNYSS